MNTAPKVLLATCGGWWLPHPAKAFENRGALAGLWISDKNKASVSAGLFRRCWPFHLAMKPFYRFAPQVLTEKLFYAFFPIWRGWVKSQSIPPCNVVQAIIGYGTELFDRKELKGTLKVVDCPNSHPLTYYGFWQRECDLWCPGEKVPIPQWMFARMNRELERADCIVVQSSFCRDSMVWNGIPESKIFINPMGVDTYMFQPRQSVPIKPRFICVGTICLRKGHQYLFRAFELVKKLLPDAELICVGQYKNDFQKERRRWEGTFRHIPHLSHADLAALLQTCTAFVFPSQEEGIARAQIEALAVGLPVIGTYEGGATTLVRDGVEGIIVRGRDPQHIADAMIQVYVDPELNRKMGEAALQKGATKNTWQDYGDRLLDAYARKLSC
jgi:glycosyltransferase involved in cell wall biosynthesis